MFLRFPESYANETDEIKESVKHFRRVRDQWLAHVDLVDPDKPGVAYPSWHEDWRRFKKILRVSASLCHVKINEDLGLPPPASFDPTSSLAKLVHAMDMPSPRSFDRTPGSSKWYDCTLPRP